MNPKDKAKYERRIQRALETEKWKDKAISKQNRALIRKFDRANVANGLSLASRYHYIKLLRAYAALLDKNVQDALKEDVIDVVATYQKGRKTKTVNNFKVAVKRFHQWLEEMDEEYPENVKWMRPKPVKTTVKPRQLIEPEEMKRLLRACTNQRDRAMLMLTYEVGPRPHEVLSMKVGDVQANRYGCMVTIPSGKTGPRRIPVIDAAPDLMRWLEQHPNREDPGAPLWCYIYDKKRWGEQGSPLSYEGLRGIFRRIINRADIKRDVWPYLFRHSALTQLSKEIPESSLRLLAGWVPHSRMPGVYLHLSGADVEEARLKARGMLPEQEEKKRLEARECPRCGTMNAPDARFCKNCSLVLDVETALGLQEKEKEVDVLMEKLFKDPEFLSLIRKRMEKINSET